MRNADIVTEWIPTQLKARGRVPNCPKAAYSNIAIVIAIDPDVEKNGVAVFSPKTGNLAVGTMSFPILLDYLRDAKRSEIQNLGKVLVAVEAGRIIKNNWHLGYQDNRRTAAAKGNAVGRNHETGRKLVECARHYGLEVIEVKPLYKGWQGAGGKISSAEFKALTGIAARTNQDARDAALIAFAAAPCAAPRVINLKGIAKR